MMKYAIEFHEDWDSYFSKLDNSLKKRVMKKILQLQYGVPARHLKQGLPFFVSEMGQYRLCYTVDEKRKIKTIYFVGNHKDYERWAGMRS